MNSANVTDLRTCLDAHIREDFPFPEDLANSGDMLTFLAHFMTPWSKFVDGVLHGSMWPRLEARNSPEYQLAVLAGEGHEGNASAFLRREVFIPALQADDSAKIRLSCHQAYWKAIPYPEFFQRVGGPQDVNLLLGDVDEPNMLGFMLYHERPVSAAGVAFMLPGLVANRTDYWIERFVRAGMHPTQAQALIQGLQTYWEESLPR